MKIVNKFRWRKKSNQIKWPHILECNCIKFVWEQKKNSNWDILFENKRNRSLSLNMMYRPNFYESTCLRCNEIVYQVDRVGPLKDFTFFHSGCFKCVTCGTKLTLKTYYNNQHKQEDKEVSVAFFSAPHVFRIEIHSGSLIKLK